MNMIFIDLSPEFVELWTSSKTRLSVERDNENENLYLLNKIGKLESDLEKAKIEANFYYELGNDSYFFNSNLEQNT